MVCVKHAPVSRVLTLIIELSANEQRQCCLMLLITDTKKDDRQRRAVNPRDMEHASSQPSFRQVPCWLSALEEADERPEGLRQRLPSLGTWAENSTRRLLPKPAGFRFGRQLKGSPHQSPQPRKPKCQVAADQKALCTADISDPGLSYTCPASCTHRQ